ncbi:hypothetical protein FDG2_0696 [Candidatus Protofrankia californiensis]|uniref:Polyprenyl synthetase n=1 Tax=Candidatus Protofrankia californiensis TaxID=1839754 RepID=A0A1C3NU51_9ACTN|nr:hypothetical protein FDG2_0696 [Candidatus Protofrankia californiensis]
MPVVVALTSGGGPGRELAHLYALDRPLSEAEVHRAAALVEASGARSWTQREADRLVAQALDHQHAADPTPVVLAQITVLAQRAVRRDH